MNNTHNGIGKRTGFAFTLIELLVVISIISWVKATLENIKHERSTTNRVFW